MQGLGTGDGLGDGIGVGTGDGLGDGIGVGTGEVGSGENAGNSASKLELKILLSSIVEFDTRSRLPTNHLVDTSTKSRTSPEALAYVANASRVYLRSGSAYSFTQLLLGSSESCPEALAKQYVPACIC